MHFFMKEIKHGWLLGAYEYIVSHSPNRCKAIGWQKLIQFLQLKRWISFEGECWKPWSKEEVGGKKLKNLLLGAFSLDTLDIYFLVTLFFIIFVSMPYELDSLVLASSGYKEGGGTAEGKAMFGSYIQLGHTIVLWLVMLEDLALSIPEKNWLSDWLCLTCADLGNNML